MLVANDTVVEYVDVEVEVEVLALEASDPVVEDVDVAVVSEMVVVWDADAVVVEDAVALHRSLEPSGKPGPPLEK